MDVFELRDNIVDDYEQFSRSFTQIRAADVKDFIDRTYAAGQFWPAPLIQLNPNFVAGGKVEDLVEEGLLAAECAKIFRAKTPEDTFGKPMTLHQHQVEGISAAKAGQSYVLTTGTGSGKSLSYFIPIVDDVLRRKQAGRPCEGISAIVVYPMNALCNSQLEELEKFLRLGYGEGHEPVTFARYTGQESEKERERIAKQPPDILLTNYVMLELVMTRFVETDKAIRNHAAGLRFLVLDELHTYRGRQGADVAMLVRRVRERFNRDLLCVGTSATMATEGTEEERNRVIASVASRLFGAEVKPENVITETLQPVTESGLPGDASALADAIRAGVPDTPDTEALARHPVAAWVERNLGLEERNGKQVRSSRPLTVTEATKRLAEDSGLDEDQCGAFLATFLLKAYEVEDVKGRPFFAFRLHQWISGAGNVFATLEPAGQRYLTLEGQQFKPGDRERALFNMAFCRDCGQEYFPVWATLVHRQPESFRSRELNDRANDEESVQYGYLMPDEEGGFDPKDLPGNYPEEWLEYVQGEPQLKSNYKKYKPSPIQVSTRGEAGSGMSAWWVPGNFRFCLHCGVSYDGTVRSEFSKLSGLSSEGRSSATTVLALSCLKHLIGTDLSADAKKLLGFTDNRQDASLQAGHFNDFIQILLLRGALLAAMQSEPGEALQDDVLTQKVFEHLHLEPGDYASNPEAKGMKARQTDQTLRDVLGYRLYNDLRRGWRLTNPNLEQLCLLSVNYQDVDDCCQDEAEWASCHPLLGAASPDTRRKLVVELLDAMRKGLCIKTRYLDPAQQEQIRNRSFNQLKEPWGLSEEERLTPSAYMVPRPRPQNTTLDAPTVHVSHRSRFGRRFKAQATWGADNPHFPAKFDEDTYNSIIDDLLRVLTTYGYVEPTEVGNGYTGYRIDASALEWRAGGELPPEEESRTNLFFRSVYENVATLLDTDQRFLHQLEAREHTAQVETEVRMDRETRFRRGTKPEEVVEGAVRPRGLPVLFCSPTMELGVDIATLNSVYMRNVPPTPANYAQRSGRAGRSGQPALVLTYCASRSPHDQYFFEDPTRMVAGAVSPPTIDLANEDLVRSHLNSVWLAETGVMLGSSVRDVLDRENSKELPLKTEIKDAISAPHVRKEAAKRADRIVGMLSDELTDEAAPWYGPQWLDNVIGGAAIRFDETFRRWRSLYRATAAQMNLAQNILNNAAAGEKERKDAKARLDEAFTQQSLLLDARASMNSDFYTYRYLASEGFLPGYNFPRLPLMAYIPGRREKVVKETFLSRPRFLGLTEFGPQSIIYHEGSTYRVRRAILTIRDEGSATASAHLPVQAARLCPSCGYGHFGDQKDFERCVNCDVSLEGGPFLNSLYRIEQVATRRATRITSDEEERQRQGYEMVTTLRFAETQGRIRREVVAYSDGDDELLRIVYGPAATLWRVNLGWRRRKEKSIHGFTIDVGTGEWTKDSQAPTDAEDDQVGEGRNAQRIIPYVEDTRNVLVVRTDQVPADSMATLQYALKRGIENEFQLEEAELAAEPLPDAEERNAILFYEAAEGGAGVLTRLTTDTDAMARVARRALQVCHYDSASGDWRNADDLKDTRPECEAGCYRCLLSYYNQPEHPLLDRRDSSVIDVLCQLMRASAEKVEAPKAPGDSFEEILNACTSSLEKEWLRYLKSRGHLLPDRAQPYLEQHDTRPDFAYSETQTVVYIDGPHHEQDAQKALDAAKTRELEDAGLTVIRFPTDKARWPDILADFAFVFGTPRQAAESEAERGGAEA